MIREPISLQRATSYFAKILLHLPLSTSYQEPTAHRLICDILAVIDHLLPEVIPHSQSIRSALVEFDVLQTCTRFYLFNIALYFRFFNIAFY